MFDCRQVNGRPANEFRVYIFIYFRSNIKYQNIADNGSTCSDKIPIIPGRLTEDAVLVSFGGNGLSLLHVS